jgi:O-antigen ligase
MTTYVPHPASTASRPADAREPIRTPDVLVIGGAVLAPLNLLIYRSFSVYDLLVFVALFYVLRERRFVWPPAGYLAAAYVFTIAALVSAFRSTYAVEAMTQVLQYAFIFFVQVPVVISVVRTRARAVTSIALLCFGTLAAILHAYVFRPTQGAGRVVVFYSENPNRLGYPAAYLIPLLIALWLLSRYAGRPMRVTAMVALLAGTYLSIWAVAASGSRSSLLGAGVALLVFVVLRPGLGLWRAAGRLLALAVLGGVVGLGLMASGQLPSTLEERIVRSLDRTDVEAQSHLVGDREHLANAGMTAFLETPLVGHGLDNFRYVAPSYDIEASPQLPHNLWLQLGVQVGAIGAAAFAVWLLLWGFDVVGTVRRAHPFDATLLWGLFASMAGILTIFMFAPEMLDRHYWLIAALGLAAVRGCRTSYLAGGRNR